MTAAIIACALASVACEAESGSPTVEDDGSGTADVTEGAQSSGTTPSPPTVRAKTVRVARVLHGDTIELRNGKRIRLVQIDAPESDGECYGDQAGRALSELLPAGTMVVLERDPALDDVDRYGRLLRYVHKGPANVNLVLVKRGAASVWFFDGDRGRYSDRLLSAARSAKAEKRGAWGACRAKLDPSSPFDPKRKKPPRVGPPPTCHPSYTGACLDPAASDYDCAGGEGDGPKYTGFVRVVGPDGFDLDRDGDGLACESS